MRIAHEKAKTLSPENGLKLEQDGLKLVLGKKS